MLDNAFVLFFCAFLILLGYDSYQKRNRYRATSNIPGPKIFPIIGSPVFVKSLDDVVEASERLLKKYGSTLKIWVFHYLLVIITSPKHLSIIANNPNCLEKGQNYKFVLDIVGNGLITSPVPIWKAHRKIINPTFNKQLLNTFVDVFAQHGKILVNKLEKHALIKDLFNVEHYLNKYTLSIVWETTMGVKLSQKDASKHFEIVTRIMQLAAERTIKVWLHPNIIFKMSKQGREFYKLLKIWKQYIEDVIIKRREELKPRDFKETPRRPFLDHLLLHESELSIEDIRDEAAVNIIGGFDTVTSALSIALVCLGMHQRVQNKAIEEIQEVLGPTDRPVTTEDLPKLVYLERVIKEAMRLYSPVVLITRRVTKEIDLGDYIVPPDAVLIIGILGTHRNPEVWPNPLEFNPDRFLPEEVLKRDSHSFLPFSIGMRDCIGKQFGMMEMKTLIATVLKSYKIETNIKPENIRLTVNMLTKIIGGSNIRITKRQ